MEVRKIQLQGKDGELRIYERGSVHAASDGLSSDGSTTTYLEVLFCEMDFTAATGKPRTEERLIMDRGNYDTESHYVEGDDSPRYAPGAMSFSCRLADTVDTRVLSDLLSAASDAVIAAGTTIGARLPIENAAGGVTYFSSFDGSTTIDGNALSAFEDSKKFSFRIEMKWTGSNDLGYRFEEVHFPPGETTITESVDGLMLSANGQCYGDVTRILSFQSGTSIIAFT